MRWIGPACVGALLITATPAMAQTGPGTEGRVMQQFQTMDADRDGKVSAAEFKASHSAWLAAMDANGDGAVSKQEFTARGGPRRAERFAQIDADGDGKLSQAEAAAVPSDMFAAMDGNGDGQLSQSEFGPRRTRQR
jgi:Ca2+-binding EF-hand superfamily protein